MDLTVANPGGRDNPLLRDYRKGNWTLQETMVLIEAKKMDNERRMKRSGDNSDRGGKPAELRWKWVEDYCWRNGCLRSQNQCNDKWDNLMRDFKKVREYERRVEEAKSYWKIDKAERKENHLPSSMLPQVYQALVEVVERKGQSTAAPAEAGNGGGSSNVINLQLPPVQQIRPIIQPQSQPQPPLAVVLTLPPQPSEQPNLPFSQPLPTVDSDSSEYSDSPAKRRKRRSGGGGSGEGTSGGGGGATLEEVGSAISRSASIIAEAIQSCEEREERRHRELLRLHERRLQIEESKAEINRQRINGLVDAINKLAASIFALATNRNNQGPPT